MSLSEAAIHILSQLADLVRQIDERDFVRPSPALGGSTIGQHMRHTIEFFLCLESGCTGSGVINYDKRAHDTLLETNKALTLSSLDRIARFVADLDPQRVITLEVGYDLVRDTYVSVASNTTRELVYNIEHAVHHMAIMKIGVREIAPYVVLPPHFGIAASTVRHRREAIPSQNATA